MQADIGLIGLAVMGQNLVLNISDHGYSVVVFNRTFSVTQKFLNQVAKDKVIIGKESLIDFIATLKRPRKIIIMVKAGEAVDAVINSLIPLLEAGDIIIDGGNSHYDDSQRRCEELAAHQLLFIGAGISGGEEGARFGPSIMPGGNEEAWPYVKEIFQSIAAKADNGKPCCDWVGAGGSGHYVKMVHNGIEYGDIQLICEAYALLKSALNMSADEIAAVFEDWNKRELDSYLIEISAAILRFKDQDGSVLLDHIIDSAGQKGTGKWTAVSALDEGVPLSLISQSVFARYLSGLRDRRIEASKRIKGITAESFQGNVNDLIEDVFFALYASKIISYAQGYMLMKAKSDMCGWKLNYGNIALMWRGGCIIRSVFLDKISESFDNNPQLPDLFSAPFFISELEKAQKGWRNAIVLGVKMGIPLPCLTAALAFFDGYRTANSSANLIQALRDYFGAHCYARLDADPSKFFHTDWTGEGGDTSSSVYSA
ncbi:6-phosphogluconate dehydrogenase, decarboxylating [Candidatus Clavichlamydia salmonicola]|uniref:decarboxylating NADP(+)-dependent phosphogluconate dehydrogenase n=1 Tax=Candidatus Clavichlamydia salmonicola TaxID=469812 RepID=UPI001891D44A|nr:decarboxylating NADP(+)-dependent phosphogluconate dehydrogenase [Candidatus Clavichlamydia salmonicola]MBF5051034.1 6-phosphogluconate dehydrogenase, decarboxylating [Candidatus Clavichlamydia salmonicola]